MAVAIAKMTVAEIQNRLSVLDGLDAAHAARDMDAELHKVMTTGGDVDAMEAAHLDAERMARRLRVERTALSTELPIAIQREGTAQLIEIKQEHAKLAEAGPAIVDDICTTWAAFAASVQAWTELQQNAEAATYKAAEIAKITKSAMPDLGTFKSARVVEVCGNARRNETWENLRSAEFGMQMGGAIQSHWLDTLPVANDTISKRAAS